MLLHTHHYLLLRHHYYALLLHYYIIITSLLHRYNIIITSLFPIAKAGNKKLILTYYALSLFSLFSLFSLLHCYYPLLLNYLFLHGTNGATCR